jgi:RNA polymerase sigma factor (sigma-70 family)
MENVSLDCFDKFTAQLIRRKAHELVKHARLTAMDADDVQQQIALELIQRQSCFDPNRGSWEAFVTVVCKSCCADILEHANAKMRSPKREACSLDRHVADNSGNQTCAADQLAEDQAYRHAGPSQLSHEEAWGLREDVAEELKQMSPTERQCCEILMSGRKSDAAREMGISRYAVYKLQDRILARLDDANLRDYLA